MWKVKTRWLCDKHLLGEHLEMHMFAGAIIKRKSLDGYLKNNLVEIANIRDRHNELAKEMIARGMNHKSELPSFNPIGYRAGRVFITRNIQELKSRCFRCRERMLS